MKYSSKGHKDRKQTQEQNKKEWPRSVGLCQRHNRQHLHHVKVSPWGLKDYKWDPQILIPYVISDFALLLLFVFLYFTFVDCGLGEVLCTVPAVECHGRRNQGPICWEPELSKVCPLKPGLSENIAMHVSPTARNFFLSNCILPGHSASFFPNPLPSVS